MLGVGVVVGGDVVVGGGDVVFVETHCVVDVLAILSVIVSGGQRVHPLLPVTDLYFPLLHAVQCCPPKPEVPPYPVLQAH